MVTLTLMRKIFATFPPQTDTAFPFGMRQHATHIYLVDVITPVFALLSFNPQLSGVSMSAESTRSSHGFQKHPKLGNENEATWKNLLNEQIPTS